MKTNIIQAIFTGILFASMVFAFDYYDETLKASWKYILQGLIFAIMMFAFGLIKMRKKN